MNTFLTALLLLIPIPSLAQTLAGIIDMHAHADPDGVPRSVDAIDLARLAKSQGMRAIVLKNHYESTAALASVVRKEVPGIEVFGGIALNLTVGGVNPAAVDWMTKMKGGYGRVVWMPTYDSEHEVVRHHEQRPFARIAKDGKLVPEAVQVITMVAQRHLVLATGHSSPAEDLLLVREGKQQGVGSMIVTHPLKPGIGMSIPEMREAVKMGAYVEITWAEPGSNEAKQCVSAIRQVGPASCILSSDLGNPAHPVHTDGLLAFLRYLKNEGLSEDDINRMARVNPAKLLGLKP